MLSAIPRRAFLRFEFPLQFRPSTSPLHGAAGPWPDKFELPDLLAIEGRRPIAKVFAAWNDEGLMIGYELHKGSGVIHHKDPHWWKNDGMRLCVSTRDSQDLRRGTRHCHFFYLLPRGPGKNRGAVAGAHHLSRARESPPGIDPSQIAITSAITAGGYSLEAHIPAACLHGWSPAEFPRIGFFYKIRDSDLYEQHFSATDEMGWNADPSAWATAVLMPRS